MMVLLYILVALILIVHIIVGPVFVHSFMFRAPTGKDEKKYLRKIVERDYPGMMEWVNGMLARGVLRDEYITSIDNLKLHAYVGECKGAKRTVILTHGFSGCAMQMMPYARMWRERLGCNVIVHDLPHHGRSEGTRTNMGWTERLVIRDWIDRAQELFPGTEIYLHGLSMGAASTLMTLKDGLPEVVKGIVSDCAYDKCETEFKHLLKVRFHMPVIPYYPLACWATYLIGGWKIGENAPINYVGGYDGPILIIHGDADLRVPVDAAYNMMKVSHEGERKLWITNGAAHCGSLSLYPDEYVENISALFDIEIVGE